MGRMSAEDEIRQPPSTCSDTLEKYRLRGFASNPGRLGMCKLQKARCRYCQWLPWLPSRIAQNCPKDRDTSNRDGAQQATIGSSRSRGCPAPASGLKISGHPGETPGCGHSVNSRISAYLLRLA